MNFDELHNQLPIAIRSFIESGESENLMRNIETICNLKPEQTGEVTATVGDVLYGYIEPKDFDFLLKKRIEIEPQKLKVILQIVDQKIFKPFKSELEQLNKRIKLNTENDNSFNQPPAQNLTKDTTYFQKPLHPLDQILKIREQTKIAQQLRRASKQIAPSESIQKSQPNISPKPDFNQPSSQIPLNKTEIKSANPQKPENTIPSSEPLPPRVVNLKNTDASKLIEAMKKPTVTSPVLEKMKELQNIPLSFEKKPQKETDKLNSLKPLTTDKTKIISSPVENLKPEIQKKKIGSSEESTIFSEFPQPSEPLPFVSPPPLVKYQKIQKEGPAFDLPLENQKTLETNKEDSNRVVFDYTKIQFQKPNEKIEENLKTSENSKNNQFSSPLLNKNEPKIKGNIVDLS